MNISLRDPLAYAFVQYLCLDDMKVFTNFFFYFFKGAMHFAFLSVT